VSPAELRDRLHAIRERIAEAATRSGRDYRDTTIVAVTKGWPENAVRLAIDAGIRDIGENRVQEALSKSAALTAGTRFHLIGHLQRNKVGKAAAVFDMIHSVSSLALAATLDEAARRAGRIVDVLVQVNVAGDPAKHGLLDSDLRGILAYLEPMTAIRVVGLMTIGPLTETAEESRPHFRALRELRDRLVPTWPGLCHLSMGMSSDYVVAVEEGATLVRIGTALFGPRTH